MSRWSPVSEDVVGLIVAVLIAGYLIVALLFPEKL
jgi:K+-transporting ATPase KdpF subunit